MNRILILFLALSPLYGTSQSKTASPKAGKSVAAEKGFVITGEITGLAKGSTVKLASSTTSAEITSASVEEKIIPGKKDGTSTRKTFFVLKGKIAEPDLCVLTIGDLQPYYVFVENGPISISGNTNSINNLVVKGSASHQDFQEFQNTFNPLAQQLNSVAATINSSPEGTSRDSLMKIYNSTHQIIQDKIDNFISTKPSSYVSPFVVLVLIQFNSDPLLAEKRFNKLDPRVQASFLGKSLSSEIAKGKIGAIGTPALEFSQPDTSGNPVSLSSFRGKFVLVDFWASWCGPCRRENPAVVQNFQKFKDKNFTVLGVSLDRPGQKAKWLQAIKDDNLTWTHVSDLKFWDNAAAKLYNVTGIPQNFLVDPNGMIIARNLRGSELEAKLCELFGCN